MTKPKPTLQELKRKTTDCEKHSASFPGQTPKMVDVEDAMGRHHEVSLRKGEANGRTCWAASTPENGETRRDWSQEGAIRAQARSCGWPQS